jgi:hypothetical protein
VFWVRGFGGGEESVVEFIPPFSLLVSVSDRPNDNTNDRRKLLFGIHKNFGLRIVSKALA